MERELKMWLHITPNPLNKAIVILRIDRRVVAGAPPAHPTHNRSRPPLHRSHEGKDRLSICRQVLSRPNEHRRVSSAVWRTRSKVDVGGREDGNLFQLFRTRTSGC